MIVLWKTCITFILLLLISFYSFKDVDYAACNGPVFNSTVVINSYQHLYTHILSFLVN